MTELWARDAPTGQREDARDASHASVSEEGR